MLVTLDFFFFIGISLRLFMLIYKTIIENLLFTYFKYLFSIDADVENYDVTKLFPDALKQVEADSYWCFAKLLDGIQDNYTFAQPGIQKKVFRLKELMQRIDG